MKKMKLVFLFFILAIIILVCDASSSKSTTISSHNCIKTIYEERIKVDGLKNQYSFLFITDTHIVVKNKADSLAVKKYADSLVGFTNRPGIQSVNAFPFWIKYANKVGVNAFIMGGDMLAYPSTSGVEFLTRHLLRLKSPYVFTIGNHDWSYPWEYFSSKGYNDYKPLYNSYNSVLEFDDLIILAIDDSTDQVDPSSLDVFKSYYKKAKPIILVMHVPISTDSVAEKSIADWGTNISIGDNGKTPNETTTAFLNLLYAKESPVVCILSGHTHAYDKSILANGIVQIVGDDGFGGNGLLLHVSPTN